MSWAANVLLIVGLYLAGNKHWAAYAFTCVGEVIWTVISIRRGYWDMAFICIMFSIMAAVNVIKWNTEKEGSE
jgi:hypothetical protein